MFLLIPLLLILAGCATAPAHFQVDPATAGTIRGKIRFEGKRPAPKVVSLDADPVCAKMYAGGTITDDSGVGNAFVYLKTGLEGKKFATPAEPAVIDRSSVFIPCKTCT